MILSEEDRKRIENLGRLIGTMEAIRPRITDQRDAEQVARVLNQLYADFPSYAPRQAPSHLQPYR